MKNSILIISFNFYNCLNNVEYIKNLYSKFFLKIYIYCDIPNNDLESIKKSNENINFVFTDKGYYNQNIFVHFYKNYYNDLQNCDGLFYTMDDNILNINILNLMDKDKLIYYYNEIKELDKHSGWHWDMVWGKRQINNLLIDNDFKKYNINKFSGAFADWFYLPKKYLTYDLFDLFDLFGKHKIFLELAIPSIINNIEKDKNKYQIFTDDVLWGENDRKKLFEYDYIYNSLNHQHNIVLHPIKFNQTPKSKTILDNIFSKDTCNIIYTKNKPDDNIFKYINDKNSDTIIVGDKNTPNDYNNLNCIYLDYINQEKLFPKLYNLISLENYSRINFGYLYAIKKGYKYINEIYDNKSYNFNNDNNIFDIMIIDSLYIQEKIKLRDIIRNSLLNSKNNTKNTFKKIYNKLLFDNQIQQNDIDILNIWLEYFSKHKYNIVYFYSEGNNYDNGLDLSYCYEPLLKLSNNIFDNVKFYTPRILKSLNYKDDVKEFQVTNINKAYSKMCKIGLSRWKPLILLLELEKMNDGDILIYRDVDYNKYNCLSKYEDIINIIDKCLNKVNFDFFISRESEDLKLGQYTKPIVIEEIGKNDDFVKNFPLLIANFIIVRKSKISIELLNEWYNLCKNDKYIDGFMYNKNDNMFKNFTTNEQSILGVIIAKWVKEKKYNINEKYPLIGFHSRNICNIIEFNNYDYLKYL